MKEEDGDDGGVLGMEMKEILEVGVMELKKNGCGGGLKKKEEGMVRDM